MPGPIEPQPQSHGHSHAMLIVFLTPLLYSLVRAAAVECTAVSGNTNASGPHGSPLE